MIIQLEPTLLLGIWIPVFQFMPATYSPEQLLTNTYVPLSYWIGQARQREHSRAGRAFNYYCLNIRTTWVILLIAIDTLCILPFI